MMMSKKVLLVSPPFYRLMGSHYNGLHLGLGYIASFIRARGFDAQIYNADFFDSAVYLDQKKLFENFDTYVNVLGNLEHPIWKEVESAISQISPDYLGIQMYTGTFKSAQNVAIIAKKINPEIKIIVGGTHPTLDPMGTISFGYYDYVVRGEGEYTFLEILEGKDPRTIIGLTFKSQDGQVIHNPDRDFIKSLDSLPYPARDALYVDKTKIDAGAMITARGCPYRCKYCASPKIWKCMTRYRSVENVLNEIEYIVGHHGVELVRFQDDTFTLKRQRVTKMCRGLIDRKLNISWVCDTRVDRIDETLLHLIKQAGCVRIKIGVESGSDEILKRVNKGITVDQVKRAVRLIKDVGIPLTIYLMIGFPGETDTDVGLTIDLAQEIDADYNSLSIISPYYGTELYNDLLKEGHHVNGNHWEYFFHQSREMVMKTNISPYMIDEFFTLNDKTKGERV
jgi:anaerobic magnesium-protoporphyrin IX monomethyl ester cyclase